MIIYDSLIYLIIIFPMYQLSFEKIVQKTFDTIFLGLYLNDRFPVKTPKH